MAFSIQTNLPSLQAQENLRVNQDFQSRTINRLTSGYRINASGDDAAGLAVANKFRSQVTELSQGVRNANDGMSQLQIIDGGLNNIAKMLDRMKTLATQSASATFSGDRSTLQSEYDKLRNEINREAANIGLSANGTTTTAGLYNKNISIYLGGGAGQSNASVAVDLSGAANSVDATDLALAGNIDGTSTATTLVAGDFGGATLYLDGGTKQTFHFKTENQAFDITVQGDTDGLTGAEIVNQLNTGLTGSGISLSIDSAGDIVANSPNAFAMSIDAKSGGGTQISAAVAADAAAVNAGMNVFKAGTLSDVAAGDGTIEFTVGGSTYTVNLVELDTKEAVFTNLQNALQGSDLKLIRLGDEVYIQSAKSFTGSFTDVDGATGGLENLDSDTAWAPANYVASTAATDVTQNAKAAILQIDAAVTKLGKVQGVVGTGQNQLSYAIQLANSQIANFSAAESRIRDTDVAAEAANLTKAQVLQQASMAAMAQANSAPQAVMALLRG